MKKFITFLLLCCNFTSLCHSTTINNTTKSTATLSSSCQFSTSDVIFGDYNPTSTEHQITSQNIDFRCTRATTFSLYTYATGGVNGSYGWQAPMTTTSSSDKLYFQVLESHVNSTYWNEDMNGSAEAYKGIATGSWQNVNFQYRILKNQYVKPGNYSTTHTMTFSF